MLEPVYYSSYSEESENYAELYSQGSAVGEKLVYFDFIRKYAKLENELNRTKNKRKCEKKKKKMDALEDIIELAPMEYEMYKKYPGKSDETLAEYVLSQTEEYPF